MYATATRPLVPGEAVEGEVDYGLDSEQLASAVAGRCLGWLRPLLVRLDRHLDVRLVRTLANTVFALIRHRNRPLALLLSELGAYLTGPEHAPAGTKRLANLVHSGHWQAAEIDDYLLECGGVRVAMEAAKVSEGRALCILDGSILEKPESAKAEGLGPVRSAKARRLARPRPKLGKGYFCGKPSGPPIVVPGYLWMGALLAGWTSGAQALTLGAWHLYHKPGSEQTQQAASAVPPQKDQEAACAVLERVSEVWGAEHLLHVWDRGFSGAPWLGEAIDKGWRFVVRWKKGNRLRPAGAPSLGDPSASAYRQECDGVKAWQLTRGKNWGSRQVANPRHPDQPLTVGFRAWQVHLLHRDEPLWLVVVRLGKNTKRRRGGNEPWRLLTNLPVSTAEECWRIVEAYAARWRVEGMLRFGKSELGVESVRVRAWEPRHKLLALVSLVYAFLLELLADGQSPLLKAVLHWAHRTGRQAKGAWHHLYRLRSALAAIWQRHTPLFQGTP
jgi:hypothetical protein